MAFWCGKTGNFQHTDIEKADPDKISRDRPPYGYVQNRVNNVYPQNSFNEM